MFTDEYLNFLISEEKIISVAPKKEFKMENQNFRNSFELISSDGKRKYSVFLRKHNEFQENFSIGLRFFPFDSPSFQLVRFNGNHGEQLKDILNPNPHRDYHIHQMTNEDLDNGLDEPKNAFVTKEYASYEQAIIYFCKYCNIKDYLKYFTDVKQGLLFE